MSVQQVSQTKTVELEIESLLNAGETNKQKIYDKVVENLGIPRPTVRRIARTLLDKYRSYAKILEPIGPPESL